MRAGFRYVGKPFGEPPGPRPRCRHGPFSAARLDGGKPSDAFPVPTACAGSKEHSDSAVEHRALGRGMPLRRSTLPAAVAPLRSGSDGALAARGVPLAARCPLPPQSLHICGRAAWHNAGNASATAPQTHQGAHVIFFCEQCLFPSRCCRRPPYGGRFRQDRGPLGCPSGCPEIWRRGIQTVHGIQVGGAVHALRGAEGIVCG